MVPACFSSVLADTFGQYCHPTAIICEGLAFDGILCGKLDFNLFVN
jgi:hypothetical protein